jgi:hypothetical protein
LEITAAQRLQSYGVVVTCTAAMDTHFEGGHSIVASFVDPSGDLFVASRESGDILKVGADSGEKSAFEARHQ